MFWRLRGKRVVDGLPTNEGEYPSQTDDPDTRVSGRDFPPELEQTVPNLSIRTDTPVRASWIRIPILRQAAGL